jgi:arginyl-tRNA synthetase
MKKLEVPNITKELEEIYKRVNKKIEKDSELSNDEINEVIQEYRTKKKTSCEVR